MTHRLNKNIAEALDMEIPEEGLIEDRAPLVTVEPHEIISVDNPDLPDLSDIEYRLVEGEKQLDDFIGKSMGMFQELYEELPEVQPDKRNRHMEVTSMIMGTTLDAIKHKTDLQLKKKKQRMEEKSFNGGSGRPQTINANFFGSREDIMKMLNDAKRAEAQNGEPE